MPKQRNFYAAKREEPFTNREMQALTGVSMMSLHLWRQGTATKSRMPSGKNDNGTVRYPVIRTLRWLERYGIELQVHPDDLSREGQRPARKKPGPITSKRVESRRAGYH